MLDATPLGKVPFIRVDGHTLCESQVIVDLLEARLPEHPLLPAYPLAAAKVRELCMFMELYVEQVGRELYAEAFFGGKDCDSSKEKVKKALERKRDTEALVAAAAARSAASSG